MEDIDFLLMYKHWGPQNLTEWVNSDELEVKQNQSKLFLDQVKHESKTGIGNETIQCWKLISATFVTSVKQKWMKIRLNFTNL